VAPSRLVKTMFMKWSFVWGRYVHIARIWSSGASLSFPKTATGKIIEAFVDFEQKLNEAPDDHILAMWTYLASNVIMSKRVTMPKLLEPPFNTEKRSEFVVLLAMDSPVVSTWAPFPCFYCCLLSTTRPGYQLRGRSRAISPSQMLVASNVIMSKRVTMPKLLEPPFNTEKNFEQKLNEAPDDHILAMWTYLPQTKDHFINMVLTRGLH
jgi:hypothetical protein